MLRAEIEGARAPRTPVVVGTRAWQLAAVALLFVVGGAGCTPGETEQALLQAEPALESTDERRQLARSCDRGEQSECLSLVDLIGVGDGVPGNSDGVLLLERSCHTHEYGPACARLAELWDPVGSDGRGSTGRLTDAERARVERAYELWDRACAIGATDSCGRAVAHAELVEQAEQAIAERERLAQEEAERVARERRAREIAANERASLVSYVRRGLPGHCNRIEIVFGVAYAICDTLIEAIANGRTSSSGRSQVQAYLRDRGVSRLIGYIVARVDQGLYEVVRRSYDSYWDISYPRGQHFLLRTELTDYTSQGRFSMWVEEVGSVPITTTNGFQQVWPIYAESILGQAWQGVRDARAGAQTSDAARELLLALMGER